MSKSYDSGYKFIFSNKTIFRELLESFVKEDFIKDIDFNTLELVEKSFVSEELLKRESDIIYKLKIKNEEIYIYVLLEFQSYVDKSIPVRMLLYILQLYDLLMRNSKKGKLPNIFPILLYNGNDRWNIPDNIKDLIDDRIPTKYIPSFEYYKIIENRISDETLLKINNLVSAIIYLENRRDKEGLKGAITKIIELIKDEKIIDIKQFTIWVNRMFENKIAYEQIEEIKNITEVKTMLSVLINEIKEEGKIEGKIEGKLEGKIEGKIEGKLEGKIEDARLMKEKGFSLEDIKEITGLTDDEIEKL